MYSLVSEKVMAQPPSANKKNSKILRTGLFGSDTVNLTRLTSWSLDKATPIRWTAKRKE
jgi:hypothetical protein